MSVEMPGNTAQTPVNAIIFDMDNTLFDLYHAKLTACTSVTKHLGKEDGTRLFEYFLRPAWGFEDWRNIRDYLLDEGIFTVSSYHEACSQYEAIKLENISVYEGIPEILGDLKEQDIPLAVLTDADRYHATRRLKKAGLEKFFDCIVTFEMTGRKKPDKAPFLLALKKLGVDTRDALMIGDSPHRDLAPAREIGMRTIYARYGDRLSAERTGPCAEYVTDNVSELRSLLRTMTQGPA